MGMQHACQQEHARLESLCIVLMYKQLRLNKNDGGFFFDSSVSAYRLLSATQ